MISIFRDDEKWLRSISVSTGSGWRELYREVRLPINNDKLQHDDDDDKVKRGKVLIGSAFRGVKNNWRGTVRSVWIELHIIRWLITLLCNYINNNRHALLNSNFVFYPSPGPGSVSFPGWIYEKLFLGGSTAGQFRGKRAAWCPSIEVHFYHWLPII